MKEIVKLVILLILVFSSGIYAQEKIGSKGNKTREFLDNFSESLETFAKKGKPSIHYLSNLNIVYSPYGDNELKQCTTYLGNIDNLPYWLKGLGSGNPSAKILKEPVEKRIDELLKILNSQAKPEIKSLAIRWLSIKKDITHVELIERFLDSDKDAAVFPFVNWRDTGKMYTINWCRLKMSEIALIALRTITYRNFPRVWGYKQWRKNNPDLKNSFDYWYYAIHFNTTVDGSAIMLEKLIKQNLPLALRILFKGKDDAYSKMPKRTSYSLFKKLVPKDEIFELVSEKVPSDNFTNEEDKKNFITWVMSYPGTMFDKKDSKKLYDLWLAEPINQNYAYAAYMLNKNKQKEILAKTVRLTRGNTRPFFLTKLARLYSFHEYELLEESFFTEDSSSKAAILESLPASKAKRKSILKRLNDDARFRKIEESLINDELQRELFFAYLETAKKAGFSLSKLHNNIDFYPKHLTNPSIFGAKIIKKDTKEFVKARQKRTKVVEMIRKYLTGI